MQSKGSEITRVEDKAQESTKQSLKNLLSHYSQFFNPQQIDALVYFWYGYSLSEVSQALDINESLVSEWLSKKTFKEAIQAGSGKRQEILINRLESHALKAVDFVGEVMDEPITHKDKGFREKISLTKWILDRFGGGLNTGTNTESGNTIKMDKETARIFADEIRKTASQSRLESETPVRIEEVFREDTIDGDVVDPSVYYKLVDSKDAYVEYGIVNIIKIDEDDYQMQCHLCGKWKNSLTMHISKSSTHSKINLTIYRKQFGIPNHIPLSVNDDFLEIIDKLE